MPPNGCLLALAHRVIQKPVPGNEGGYAQAQTDPHMIHPEGGKGSFDRPFGSTKDANIAFDIIFRALFPCMAHGP